MPDFVDLHASFHPATAEYIKAEAKRQGVSRARIIRGLVRLGIKALHKTEDNEWRQPRVIQSRADTMAQPNAPRADSP